MASLFREGYGQMKAAFAVPPSREDTPSTQVRPIRREDFSHHGIALSRGYQAD